MLLHLYWITRRRRLHTCLWRQRAHVLHAILQFHIRRCYVPLTCDGDTCIAELLFAVLFLQYITTEKENINELEEASTSGETGNTRTGTDFFVTCDS